MKILTQIFALTGLFLVLCSQNVQAQQLSIQSISATPSSTCSQQTVQLSVTATGGTGNYNYSWVGNPGSFTSSLQNPTTFPSVNTTYTVVVNDGSSAVQSEVSVAVTEYPEVDAGDDATICENQNTYQLSGIAYNYSYLEWSTQGDGTFTNTSISNATYTPGEEDVENGSVILTFHAFATPPCTGFTSDQMILTIAANPTVEAGDDQEICANENVSLSADAEEYSSVYWASSGDGYFSAINTLQTTYIPGSTDLSSGSVSLTLTASANSPCTSTTSDNLNVSITPEPIANAGTDDEICEGDNYTLNGSVQNESSLIWSSDGDGNFQNPNQISATYIPGTQDIQDGQVTLTMTATGESACLDNQDIDSMVLDIFQEPSVSAGSDATICENGAYTLSPISEFVESFLWTSSGDGSFDDSTLENPTYTPGVNDIQNGLATITVNAYAISPCGGTDSDEMIINIDPLPEVTAGDYSAVCDNDAFVLENAVVNNAASLLWTTNGDGSFNNATIVNATYTPGVLDAQNGSVELTLTAQPEATCTDEITDNTTLAFIAGPQVNAGSNASICEDATYTTNATQSNSDELLWTTSGDGSFSGSATLTATYTPGVADIAAEEVYLILTGTNASCSFTQDSLLLSIIPNPDVQLGEDEVFCVSFGDDISITLEGEASNYASVEWTTDGEGQFSNQFILDPTYTFMGSDFDDQTVTLTLSAYPNNPCLNPVSDEIVISFNYNPVADAGDDGEICEGDTIQLDGNATLYANSVYWFRLPESGGEFIDQNTLDAQYIPFDEDFEAELVEFRLQVQNGDCAIDYDTVVYTIGRSPSVNAGDDAATCIDNSVQLEGGSEYVSGIQWDVMEGSDGTFSDNEIENPIYTPGSSDIANGFAKVVLSGWAQAPCEDADRDTLEITIYDYPTVVLDDDFSICSSEEVELTADAENFSAITWTTSGDGTFTIQDLTTQYVIGENDITEGTVTITFTAEPNYPCTGSVEDEIIITINESPAITMDHVIAANYNESYTFSPTVTASTDNLHYMWTPEYMFTNNLEKDATTIDFPVDGDDSYLFELQVTNQDNFCVTTDTTRVYLDLGDVSLDVTADPINICEEGTTTLYPNASGGTGYYTYYWQDDNSTWTSTDRNPTVSPEERTTYTVIVSDENTSPSGSVTIEVQSNPTTPSISGSSSTSQYAEEVYTTTGSDLAYYYWWAKNGSVITGQGTKSATIEWGAAGNGIVYMQMASEYGCYGDTSTVNVSIGTTSVEEMEGIENLVVYPNPAKDHLNIEFVLEEKATISYEVIDATGNVIHQTADANYTPGIITFQISLSDKHEGLYLLRLRVNEHQTIQRFIKLR